MKAKLFRVTVTGFMDFAVLAETQDEAEARARDEVSCGDFQVDDTTARECTKPEEINSTLRHADEVDYDLKAARKFAMANPHAVVPHELLEIED